MNELFKKTGNSIFTFKPGDIIIRLRPMVTEITEMDANLGISVVVGERKSNSFRTTPGEFVGIYNNLIYIKYLCFGLGGSVCQLEIGDYSEDWALFEIPEGLTLDDCV